MVNLLSAVHYFSMFCADKWKDLITEEEMSFHPRQIIVFSECDIHCHIAR